MENILDKKKYSHLTNADMLNIMGGKKEWRQDTPWITSWTCIDRKCTEIQVYTSAIFQLHRNGKPLDKWETRYD